MASTDGTAAAPPSWEGLRKLADLLDPSSRSERVDQPVGSGDELPSWDTLTRLAELLGVRVEAGDGRPCPVDPARVYIVRFLNQTANKPLHLGHLRNSALGCAAAGCAAALGARVLRQCVVEDTGRYMTEAMAAVAAFEQTTDIKAAAAVFDKPDHFIGSCYRQYRQANAARKGGVTATTEYEARDDAADAIQLALMSEDEPAKRLWRTVRTMALAGQQATLRQLGVAFECCDYESAEDSYVKALIERGLDDGLFDRTPAGEVVYLPAAGRKLRLRNAAGLPEESARLVSLIRRLLTGWAGNAIHVIVAGTEWRASMRVYPELMHRLGITHVHDSYAQAFYGMIMRDGRKMSSSDGSGVLVDHFLRTVASPPPLAATVLKSFLLAVRRADPIAFDARALRDRGNNPGWELAEAWQTLTPQERGGPAPRPSADAQQLMADALSRISFDHAIHRARALARAVIADAATPRQRADFRVLVDALSLRPEPSSFAFDRAVPLATMPAPSWAAA